jgi:hypothetical protein
MSDYRRGFWIIGFTGNLQAVATNNYDTIADFHTLQIILADSTPFRPAIYLLDVSW